MCDVFGSLSIIQLNKHLYSFKGLTRVNSAEIYTSREMRRGKLSSCEDGVIYLLMINPPSRKISVRNKHSVPEVK